MAKFERQETDSFSKPDSNLDLEQYVCTACKGQDPNCRECEGQKLDLLLEDLRDE